MAKTRQQKKEALTKLADRLGRAKAVVFAEYKGLSMKHLSDLRDKLREQNSEFAVTKNTLFNKILPSAKLEGQTAALFAYDDEISPIKILVKTLKDAGLGKVKNGFLGDIALDEQKILQLATLPSKIELLGKTVSVLVAPLQGMVSVLNGNLRNLVYTLNQIKLSKGGV